MIMDVSDSRLSQKSLWLEIAFERLYYLETQNSL